MLFVRTVNRGFGEEAADQGGATCCIYEYACASRLWTRSKRAFVRLAAEDGIGPLVAELLAPIVKA